MKKSKTSAIIIVTIVIICAQYLFPMSQVLANEAVDVNVVSSQVVDIVLAKSKTKVDVSHFEEDLKKELSKQGIAENRVKINAVEAVEANIQDSFSWDIDVSSTIGSIEIANGGQDIVMKGNKKYLGKNAIWIIPEKEQEQEIQFDYSVDFGDSFNAAGMLLRVKREGDTLTGYMLSLNKSNKAWYKTAGNKYGAIWKFTYKLGTNTTNMTKTFVQGVDIQTSGTLNIKSTDTEIIISGGGLKAPLRYEMDTEYGYGFGFFSDHYSHNCSKIGAFKLGNIKLTTMTVKKFKEVLSNPAWRENSVRVLVNVDDSINEELEDKSSLATLQTRLINEQINSVFWGTDKNQAQANQVIEANNNHGKFVNNTDYINAINTTVEYIKSLINQTESSQYALIGENVKLKVTPESAKTDTATPEFPNGKWKVNHDYEYFENNLGQFKDSGKYMSDLSLSFDKTGRYELLYEDGNIVSKYIYVHRRPVANFTVEQTGSNITVKSTSYDLDSYSNNNGIAEEEWKYKKVGEKNWTDGKLTNLEGNDVYVIQLRVKDFQETWSVPVTRYAMYGNTEVESVPVASFQIKKSTLSKYEELQVENSSYDPAGQTITDEIWTVKKGGTVLYTGKTPLTDYSSYEVGNYTMSLVVTNQSGKSSEEFSRIFELVGDTIAPEVVVTKEYSEWTNQAVEIGLNFADKGGSGFKGYQYAVTESKEVPTLWSEEVLKENDLLTIDTEGEKYLHIISSDNAGNVSEDRVFGPYKIDFDKPEVESIVPENKDWTNESIDVKATFSDKGGSGVAGYKYAITTGKTTPETWSEIIKEEKAKFTISGEAEYYVHLMVYDRAGNESGENVYGPYQLDKTSPEVEVSPSFSDWTNQPVTVDVKLTDKGGSDIQKYQYAITNSGIMPEEWMNEEIGQPKPILIDTEGENYLHMIAYDNAGNDSSNFIFGKYKIDTTLPELTSDNEVNSDTNVSSIKFTAKDNLSGISKLIVNGTEVKGTEYIVTKNGDYKFEVYDEAGNLLTKSVTIHNINSVCNKKLGHPEYNSSYAKCPICDLIEGIKITENEKIYEGNPAGISYENTKNAQIVEYYDTVLDKPAKVGQYQYELKVIYNGIEYNTGITGTFYLKEKPAPKEYHITYENVNGADNSQNLTTYTMENGIVELKDIQKAGYTFEGWYAEKEFVNKITSINCKDLEDKIVYAKWTANTYTINYKNCEDIIENENPTQYTIESEKIILQPVKKLGYTFEGWYAEAEFTNKVTEINPVELKNIEVYARWKKIEEENEIEILYVKSNVYPMEENKNSFEVPKETVVVEFLKNIQTNAAVAEVYSPEEVKLGNNEVIENNSTLVIEKNAKQKKYKIYVKEETTENKIATTKRIIKDKLSGILPYTGRQDKTMLIIASGIVLFFSILFRRVFAKKGKH